MKGSATRHSAPKDYRREVDESVAGGSLSGSNLSILPRLLAGSGGLGLGTFVKLADAMGSFVPSADQSYCPNVRWRKKAICSATCVSLCPSKAISVTDSISIDPTKCISCNICATSCPNGVFDPKIPSYSGLYDEILAVKKNGKNIVQFSCSRCNGKYGKPRKRRVKSAGTIVLPCLGSLSEALLVYAMRLDCQVTIDPCPEDCTFSEGRKCYGLAVNRLEKVKKSYVVKLYDAPPVTSNSRIMGLERRKLLLSAAERIIRELFDMEEQRGSPPSPDHYGQSLPPRRKELIILTKGLEPVAGNVNLKDYPILDIRINKALCSLCNVCSKICPTGALSSSERGNSGSIIFSLGRCIGCRLCVEVCPESCICSSDASLSDMNSDDRALVEKQIYKCRSCNFKFIRYASFAGEEICPMCMKRSGLLTACGRSNRVEDSQNAPNH